MSDEDIELDGVYHGRIRVAFGFVESGWVQMALLSTAYLQSIVILCSHVYDPFPGIVEWLDQIADGKLPAEFTIDEEGREKRLLVTECRMSSKLIFRVLDDAGATPVQCIVDRKEILDEFVGTLQKWLAEVYDPFAYTCVSPDDWEKDHLDHRTISLLPLIAKVNLL